MSYTAKLTKFFKYKSLKRLSVASHVCTLKLNTKLWFNQFHAADNFQSHRTVQHTLWARHAIAVPDIAHIQICPCAALLNFDVGHLFQHGNFPTTYLSNQFLHNPES